MTLAQPVRPTPFYKSKTLWFNVGIAALAGVLQGLGKLPSDTTVPAYILTGANFLLRLITGTPIVGTPGGK